MKIKNICKYCNHIEIKKKTWKTRTLGCVKSILIVFILLTSVLGATGVYNLLQTNLFENPDLIFSIGQSYAFVNNFASNFQSGSKKSQLKEIANNLTKDCEEEDEYCKAKKIFDELWTFDYLDENATNLDPINTWNNREGDCDMMSYLFMSLASTQGISSMLSCSIDHCWVVVHLKNPKKTIVADLTGEGWVEK